MLFNSLSFTIFLPIVFILYWMLRRRNLHWQNTLLLISSYIFYGWWDWRFLSLIFISSIADYIVGMRLEEATGAKKRKVLLIISLCVNLGILGFFKYFGFFIESFVDFMSLFGLQSNVKTLRIILPVGISFYTFQTLSYTIDIYRGKIKATRDPIAFFAFVSFFPQLVAGPIERAKNLLPQFQKQRVFDVAAAKDGLRQMLWGLVKKVVVADNLAIHIDQIYSNYTDFSGSMLAIGTFLFAVQIYCDFSGYSDIAIGTARLFGFKLMRNFAYPYFSRDIGEFWRRWHISLSSWFRDYVYIPLGGSRTSKPRHILNTIITFTVSGFWHGANWTFVIWGLLNGLYYLPLLLFGKQKQNTDTAGAGRILPSLRDAVLILITFILVNIAWVFFRADSLGHALGFLGHMFTHSWGLPTFARRSIIFGVVLLAAEWFQREKQHGLQIENLPVYVRWPIYYGLIIILLLLGNTGHVPFIYFQF
jgi:alginate O-acetyltransferase complex protein AlgI